jgi:hypothetical protein
LQTARRPGNKRKLYSPRRKPRKPLFWRGLFYRPLRQNGGGFRRASVKGGIIIAKLPEAFFLTLAAILSRYYNCKVKLSRRNLANGLRRIYK